MVKTWLVSGDTHGSLTRYIVLKEYEPETAALIILGDVAFNYTGELQDIYSKRKVNQYKNYVYCVRGNHEMRPSDVSTMQKIWDKNVKNEVYYELEYPYIRYFIDGYLYSIGGYSTLVIGGAYSVDKYYRLNLGRKWFPNEQLTTEEMDNIYKTYTNSKVDFVLSHTCPLSWQPTDLFLTTLDQSTIDDSMEVWMDSFKDVIDWKVWLFGHYHRNRLIRPHVEMLFDDIQNLEDVYMRWNSSQAGPFPFNWEVDPNFTQLDNKWGMEEKDKWKF